MATVRNISRELLEPCVTALMLSFIMDDTKKIILRCVVDNAPLNLTIEERGKIAKRKIQAKEFNFKAKKLAGSLTVLIKENDVGVGNKGIDVKNKECVDFISAYSNWRERNKIKGDGYHGKPIGIC